MGAFRQRDGGRDRLTGGGAVTGPDEPEDPALVEFGNEFRKVLEERQADPNAEQWRVKRLKRMIVVADAIHDFLIISRKGFSGSSGLLSADLEASYRETYPARDTEAKLEKGLNDARKRGHATPWQVGALAKFRKHVLGMDLKRAISRLSDSLPNVLTARRHADTVNATLADQQGEIHGSADGGRPRDHEEAARDDAALFSMLQAIAMAAVTTLDLGTLRKEKKQLLELRKKLVTTADKANEIRAELEMAIGPENWEADPFRDPLRCIDAALEQNEHSLRAYRIKYSGPLPNNPRQRLVAETSLDFYTYWIGDEFSATIPDHRPPKDFALMALTILARLELIENSIETLFRDWTELPKGSGRMEAFNSIRYAVETRREQKKVSST